MIVFQKQDLIRQLIYTMMKYYIGLHEYARDVTLPLFYRTFSRCLCKCL